VDREANNALPSLPLAQEREGNNHFIVAADGRRARLIRETVPYNLHRRLRLYFGRGVPFAVKLIREGIKTLSRNAREPRAAARCEARGVEEEGAGGTREITFLRIRLLRTGLRSLRRSPRRRGRTPARQKGGIKWRTAERLSLLVGGIPRGNVIQFPAEPGVCEPGGVDLHGNRRDET